MIYRIPRSRVPAPRLVEIGRVGEPANEPRWPAVERRVVAWMFVLCAVLAAAILLKGAFA